MYFLKKINYIDGTVTIGDLKCGESDIEIALSELSDTCKHTVSGIMGVRFAENGAIVSMQTATDIVASSMAFWAGLDNSSIRIVRDGEIIAKDAETGKEIVVNSFDTQFLQTITS